MEELIQSIITQKNGDVAFVGSMTLLELGIVDSISDIDIVVRNLDGLDVFGEIITWDTDAPMSLSGRRAHIQREDYNIDIFIEPVLPAYIEKNGIKYQSLDNLLEHINWCISVSDGKYRDKMIEKRDRINSQISIKNGE
jgi:hypothetical protein